MGWALRALWGKWVCATVGEGWEGHSRAQPDASYSWPLPILSAHLGRNRYFPCTLPCWVPPPWHGIFSADQCYSKYTSQLPPVLTCLGVLASILDIPVIVLTFQILCYLMKTWGHNLVILVMATCYHMKITPWVGSSLDDQRFSVQKRSVWGFLLFPSHLSLMRKRQTAAEYYGARDLVQKALSRVCLGAVHSQTSLLLCF